MNGADKGLVTIVVMLICESFVLLALVAASLRWWRETYALRGDIVAVRGEMAGLRTSFDLLLKALRATPAPKPELATVGLPDFTRTVPPSPGHRSGGRAALNVEEDGVPTVRESKAAPRCAPAPDSDADPTELWSSEPKHEPTLAGVGVVDLTAQGPPEAWPE